MLSISTQQTDSRRVRGLRGTLSAKASLAFALLGISNAYAGQAVLAWDQQTDPQVTGYMIYYGQSSRNYTTKLDAGKSANYTINGLVDGKTYYFAVTSYNAAHTESSYSNEISRTLAASTAPTATFTASKTSGVAPLSVTFTNTSSGTITGYSWNFGDGTTSTAASPTHVYSTAGSYTVTLTATGSNGSNTQTKANLITVSSSTTTPTPPSTTAPVANFTSSATTGSAPLVVNFTSTSTGSVSSYAWSFGDGTSINTSPNPSHTYMSAGTYTVTLKVTNSAGSTTKTGTVTVSNSGTTSTTRQGLVAAYSFDEGTGSTVADKSGNGNTGTIANATWTTGRFGKALSFNGTNSMVSVADKSSLHLTSGMTLEAWVRPTTAMNAWRAIVVKEQPGDISYYLYANSDKNQPAAGDFIGSEKTLYGNTQLPVNAWTHMAATYDGTTQRLYINGALVASRAQTGTIQTSTNPLRIGGDSLWDEYFQGFIDEVRIYNRALSVAEIQGDMNTAIGSTSSQTPTTSTPTPAPSTKQDLVAAYAFDEGTGSTVTDKSGNGNNGTIANGSWTTGRFGKALSFNGTNSRVTVRDSATLDLSSGMTLEAWIRPTTLMSNWRTVLMKEQPGGIAYYLYANSDNNQPVNGIFVGAEKMLYGNAQPPANAWTHLAATYDGSSQKLYVNGALVASRAQTGAIKSSTSPLNIGSNSVWGEYFQGAIDEIRIYNRPLSVSEIQSDMNQSVGGAQ